MAYRRLCLGNRAKVVAELKTPIPRLLAILGTVRTRINDPCARTLDLPLSVRFGVFFFFFWLSGQIFGVFFAPFPEEEISDYIAQGSFIRVLTVLYF